MGRNTLFRKMTMNDLNSNLNLLENLSKKISDLLYNNEFSRITEIDNQRKAIIKKIKESHIRKNQIKTRIAKLSENNLIMINDVEKKFHKLSKTQNKFEKRIKAYSSIK